MQRKGRTGRLARLSRLVSDGNELISHVNRQMARLAESFLPNKKTSNQQQASQDTQEEENKD
ncbi:MAG: hypothetical protein IJP82_06330 [Bacteroidaceae bacterium]|nr:hypothetical protein [Bacteroidaceae bacterium]